MINKKCTLFTSIIAISFLTSACSHVESEIKSNLNVSSSSTNVSNVNVPKDTTKTLKLTSNGENFNIPLSNQATKKYNYIATTNKGVVWVPAPEMSLIKGTENNPVYTPDKPFILYFNNESEKNLTTQNSKKLLSLPLKDGEAKIVITSLMGSGDSVIYHTSSSFDSGNQPLKETVWVMKVDDPSSNKAIFDFNSTGGSLYSYGLNEQHNLYIGLSQLPDGASGSYTEEVKLYDIQKNKLELVTEFKSDDKSITIKYDNQDIKFDLIPA